MDGSPLARAPGRSATLVGAAKRLAAAFLALAAATLLVGIGRPCLER
ncbi:MAG: hypothetical protein AVDCRST_MAG08-176 [uncultured Acetobacteraceae bacterium]|uniref:Uncharacterized protein n=1 Tax=uncultured Acetobacteraceae bacterium TaxID=169975 RepID=A0A6J4H222_9PROT|nr:MAG: hypothetical protein AVDCRST_MAG08-176 [uncultured Acetobacteraceae bacterium]